MERYERKNRGYMGVAIFAVLAVFFALHLALPETTLWPAALVILAAVTMVVSHVQGGRHSSRSSAQPSVDNRR